jgi:hypothetical protein
VRPLASTCAIGVGLGATASVNLCHRSGLGCNRWRRLVPPEWAWVRPLASTCATGVGLGATVRIDLCHRSGLGCDRSRHVYLGHGFQTQVTEREYLGYLDPWY